MNKKKQLITSIFFVLITVSISAKNGKDNTTFPSEVNHVGKDCCAPTQNDLAISAIEYIEDKDIEAIDLGFDVWLYLPEGFDAYGGMLFELDDIEYIELEEDCQLYMGDINDVVPSK
ncbi:hypothetical protein [Allomuricauda sp. SCSIO 65647]|uniref:hypothetical protein n=1 Tax=Allomuricauda sp. SCSIO 65647 TaxID=2908843 RepID=UPI001F2E762B|nr:hypothetical protein [Muricauda sp. SCSIO 65647]UJH66174.1 hypothetical protein L0P89_09325 [Muricauda sp. SCSIO 65647]